jgi:hypothetical protein
MLLGWMKRCNADNDADAGSSALSAWSAEGLWL